MDNVQDPIYEPPTFEVEEIGANELAADFNPADVCVIVGAGITAGVIYAAAKCGSAV